MVQRVRRVVLRTAWAAAVAIASAALPAAAQEPVATFEQLGTRLKKGDKVWVTDNQGRETKGRIASVRPAALEVRSTSLLTLQADEVRLVVQERQDSLKNGLLWGAVVGFGGMFGLVCAGDSEMCSDPEGKWGVVFLGLLGSAGGMGIGAGIDGLIHGKDVVYRAPGSRPTAQVAVAPLVGRSVKGLRVSFSF